MPSPAHIELEAVKLGCDVLQQREFDVLRGKRVGLITNHTGVNSDGVPTARLLRDAPAVDLRTLFSPEHGLAGALDDEVRDETDAESGLPVYSLYGERVRPTDRQLANLDALVYDIQDVGARFYTYSSTLGYCLEEAARLGIEYVVLDRPNPIGGLEIEGPIADADRLNFIAYHTTPVRHGLTFGELARLYTAEKHLSARLHVVAMQGWRRDMLWDATNLTWVTPSPNMRSLRAALLYPGIGLLETTNLSVGRGTDTPFEVLGAPWIDGRRLAAELNSRGMAGVRFVADRFTPGASKFAGQSCGGVQIIVTCRDAFVPVLTGVAIAETLQRVYPETWERDRFDGLLVNRDAMSALCGGATAEELVRSWSAGVESFRERCRPHVLYGP